MTDPTLLVLASLSEGEKHGYAMMEDIQRLAGVRLGPGTLYGAITRMEERGWIKPVPSNARRQPYCLTGINAIKARSVHPAIAGLEQACHNVAAPCASAIRRDEHGPGGIPAELRSGRNSVLGSLDTRRSRNS